VSNAKEPLHSFLIKPLPLQAIVLVTAQLPNLANLELLADPLNAVSGASPALHYLSALDTHPPSTTQKTEKN